MSVWADGNVNIGIIFNLFNKTDLIFKRIYWNKNFALCCDHSIKMHYDSFFLAIFWVWEVLGHLLCLTSNKWSARSRCPNKSIFLSGTDQILVVTEFRRCLDTFKSLFLSLDSRVFKGVCVACLWKVRQIIS